MLINYVTTRRGVGGGGGGGGYPLCIIVRLAQNIFINSNILKRVKTENVKYICVGYHSKQHFFESHFGSKHPQM